jgi:hypothetical protein
MDGQLGPLFLQAGSVVRARGDGWSCPRPRAGEPIVLSVRVGMDGDENSMLLILSTCCPCAWGWMRFAGTYSNLMYSRQLHRQAHEVLGKVFVLVESPLKLHNPDLARISRVPAAKG